MAYELIKYMNKFNDEIRYFQCAALTDISSLPNQLSSPKCATGSMCLVEENAAIFILGVDHNWKELDPVTISIVNDLVTDNAYAPLSAAQGKVLKELIDQKIAKASIADNLTTDDATKVLSAKQGKILAERKANDISITDEDDNFIADNVEDALRELQENKLNIGSNSDLIQEGTTNLYHTADRVNTLIDEKTTNDLSGEVTGKVVGAVKAKEIENILTNAARSYEAEFTPDPIFVREFTRGYHSVGGGDYPSLESEMGYTNQIPVNAGDIITATQNGSNAATLRFVTAYVDGVADVGKGDSTGVNVSYTVPEGVTSVVVTIYAYIAIATKPAVKRSIPAYSINKYNTKKNDFGQWNKKLSTMVNGDFISFPWQDIKHQEVYAFSANITTFSKIIIGRYVTNTYKSKMTIDETNVTLRDYNGTETTQAHGLTMTDNIQVRIEKKDSNYLNKITITSGGNVYECTNLDTYFWVGDSGNPRFESDGSLLTDVSASYTSRHINKPIWLFGDSYFSFYPERWTYYLIQDSYQDNCLINGFAGEGSGQALNGLKKLLAVSTPKYIVWCLGMNDPDSAEAVSSAWNTAYEELKTICADAGITLILATIPNAKGTTTPYLHDYKNAIIKSSGYRYIDFAAAVNADAEGNWIAGTLDVDGIHPTVLGAKCLYYRVLADFPEITSKP